MSHKFSYSFFSASPADPGPPPSEEAMRIRSPHGRTTSATTLPPLALALAVLLCVVTGQGENRTQSPAQVLQDLLARYGDNSTITVPQLRSLLSLLSQGEGDGDGSDIAETTPTIPPKSNRSKVRTKITLHYTGFISLNALCLILQRLNNKCYNNMSGMQPGKLGQLFNLLRKPT